MTETNKLTNGCAGVYCRSSSNTLKDAMLLAEGHYPQPRHPDEFKDVLRVAMGNSLHTGCDGFGL